MKTIKKELSILKKSFPFIKFSFKEYGSSVNIIINDEDDCCFSYNSKRRLTRWICHKIHSANMYYIFNHFLDKFIWGLICHKIY